MTDSTEKKPRTKPEDRRYSHDLSLELSREIRTVANTLRMDADDVREIVLSRFQSAEKKLLGSVGRMVLDEQQKRAGALLGSPSEQGGASA